MLALHKYMNMLTAFSQLHRHVQLLNDEFLGYKLLVGGWPDGVMVGTVTR